jgi:nucleoside-diphosphate-sugar epimerase
MTKSGVLVTGGPGLVGSSVILRLLAAGRAVRTKVESPMRAAGVRAMLASRKGQPAATGSFSTADRDHDAGRLDVVAGSEFLDDRIRLRE